MIMLSPPSCNFNGVTAVYSFVNKHRASQIPLMLPVHEALYSFAVIITC
jgi:hypothetical protein